MYGYGCGKYRYKLAKTPNDQWCIIKLELFHISRTNEKRKNVINDKFAKYRTDLAKVISITDVHNDVKYKKAESAFRDVYKSYVSGSYVSSNFDENIENLCTEGIHYFKSEKAAKSYLCKTDLIGKNYFFNENTGDKGKMKEYDENRKLIRIKGYGDHSSYAKCFKTKIICELNPITRIYRKWIDNELIIIGEVDDDRMPIGKWEILTDKKSYKKVVSYHDKVKRHYRRLY